MFFDKMLDGFAYHKIVVDKSGKPVDYIFVEVNHAFEKMTGLKRRQIIGKKVTDVLVGIEKDPSDWIGIYGKVALTGEPVQFENHAEPLDKWFRVTAYCPEKGYFVALFEDITERKKAEDDLLESERRLKRSQKIAHLGSWELDLVKNKLLWSDEIYRIFGLKPQEFGATYEAFLQAVHPDDREAVDSAYSGSLREGRDTYEIEHRVVRKSTGEIRVVYEKCDHVRDKTGKITRSIGMVQDITERKKAEESVARQAELINLSPDAIIVRKLDGHIIFWSKGAEKLYGWTKEEAIGQNVNLLLKTQLPQSLKEIQNELKTKGTWSGEIVHICKDGRRLVVQSYWLGKLGSNGKIFEVLESNVDVTERIQMQLKLEESAVRLEEYATQMEEIANQRAEQLKEAERLAAIGATAGMVGHDIRNPLQSITGDLYLAKTELAELPENEQKVNALESLNAIEENIDYINKIVADLQDFARPLNPRVQETDVKSVVQAILAKNGVPKNIKVDVAVEDKAKRIMADPDFLKRILANLTLNAVQAMPDGGKLSICAYSDEKTNEVLLIVEDTGIGIPEDIKLKLFTPMMTTKSKGQGFGLAVVKRMTEGLGGTVTFESIEGKGTTFIVRLPQSAKG